MITAASVESQEATTTSCATASYYFNYSAIFLTSTINSSHIFTGLCRHYSQASIHPSLSHQQSDSFPRLPPAIITNKPPTILPLCATLVIPRMAAVVAVVAYALVSKMASLPPFLARLARPFTGSAHLSVASETNGGGAALPDNAQLCTVAAGCFWGVEHIYRKHFADKGLLDAKVGYIGGDLSNPSYRAVCGGKTGRESCPLVPRDRDKDNCVRVRRLLIS